MALRHDYVFETIDEDEEFEIMGPYKYSEKQLTRTVTKRDGTKLRIGIAIVAKTPLRIDERAYPPFYIRFFTAEENKPETLLNEIMAQFVNSIVRTVQYKSFISPGCDFMFKYG